MMVNKSETPITKFKAAVYQKTPAPWLPSKPKFLTIIIIMQIILICVSQEWRDSRVAWLILGILIPVSGWLLMRWRIYSSVFITPSGRSKKTITDQRWKEFYFSGWGEERMKAHYLKSEIESEDTILYLHGYNSSLGKKKYFKTLNEKKIISCCMELIPRISRAQSMDVLSSQANLAGYRSVIDAAEQFGKAFPMMMTAAGRVNPTKVMVLGSMPHSSSRRSS